MKTQTILITLLFSLMLGSVSAQKKNVKANSEKTTTYLGGIGTLLDSKTFEFVANTAFPISGSPKNLVGSNYSINFSPEMIISNLPFYGRGYSGMALGNDTGMRFKGKPENFTISKKKNYQVSATVNGENDTYSISISVSESGYATLSISSNDRGTISYNGEIVDVQK